MRIRDSETDSADIKIQINGRSLRKIPGDTDMLDRIDPIVSRRLRKRYVYMNSDAGEQ